MFLAGLSLGALAAQDRQPRRAALEESGPALALGQMAAAEDALAISPEQREPWTALLFAAENLLNTMHPLPRVERALLASHAQAEAGARSLNELPAVRRLESMIERSRDHTLAGLRLREAIDDLSAVLSPEQVEQADALLTRHLAQHETGRAAR